MKDNEDFWNAMFIRNSRMQGLRIHYLLAHSKLERLKTKCPTFDKFSNYEWSCIFKLFHGVQEPLLYQFFNVGLEEGSFMAQSLFKRTARIAAAMYPTMRDFLQGKADEKLWQDLDLPTLHIYAPRVVDCEEAGGDLHMQPLVPFTEELANLSGKTFCLNRSKLFIDRDNVLHYFRRDGYGCVHVREFADGKVSSYCSMEDGVLIKVQHGDVIAVTMYNGCPSFLSEPVDFTSLAPESRFERLKAFFYLAKDETVLFLAIMERDPPAQKE